MIFGQLAVTSNLTHRHMRCDNHCPRCGVDDETMNHAIFECPPALQTWAHAETPTPPLVFPAQATIQIWIIYSGEGTILKILS